MRNGKRERLPEIHFYEWSLSRWLGSETRMLLDAAGRNIYRELLDFCYKDGSIPKDPDMQARMTGATREQVEAAWLIISKHFHAHKKDSSRLTNRSADLFRRQFFSYISKQREHGSKKGTPKGSKINNKEKVPSGLPVASQSQEETNTNTNKETNTELRPASQILEEDFYEFRSRAQELQVLQASDTDWDRWALPAWRALDIVMRRAARADLEARPADSPEMRSLPQNYLKERRFYRPLPKPRGIEQNKTVIAAQLAFGGDRR